jgi:hypothetical protein
VEIPATAFGDDTDLTRRRTAVFGAVIGSENLNFLDSVHVRAADGGAVRSCTNANRAVVGDEVILRAAAVDVEAADVAMFGSSLFLVVSDFLKP